MYPLPPPPRKSGGGGAIGVLIAVVVIVVLIGGGVWGWTTLQESLGNQTALSDVLGSGGSGSSSNRQAVEDALLGYAADLKRGDWHAAAARICPGSPTREMIESLGEVMQGADMSGSDFEVVVDSVNVTGDTATLSARYRSDGEMTAPLPGRARKENGQWCLVD